MGLHRRVCHGLGVRIPSAPPVETLLSTSEAHNHPLLQQVVSSRAAHGLLERFSQQMRGDVVAAMSEPARRVCAAYRIERLGGGLQQGLAGASPYPAQDTLHLREGLLYGREVRRVGWQEQDLRSGALHQIPHPLDLVDLEVVHYHDLPAP